MRTILLIGIFALLSQAGCTNIVDGGAEIEFTEMKVWTNNSEPGTYVIRTEAEWKEFVVKNVPPIYGQPELPDFEKEMVIGVSWGGECRFSGCSFEKLIERVGVTSSGEIKVSVASLKIDGPCEMCLEPIHFATIPKTDLPVAFYGDLPK